MTVIARLMAPSIRASESETKLRGRIGDRRSGSMRYPIFMEHLEVLREKIGRLRVEIAQIQELNRIYRLQGGNGTEAQVAHGQRHERLQAIQHELAQLATLGSRVRSVAELKERHRSRLQLVKKAS